jgi:cellulose synthase/poly-beta-1,6-N-acetylglucosamine synthase-like glycosyltransferase
MAGFGQVDAVVVVTGVAHLCAMVLLAYRTRTVHAHRTAAYIVEPGVCFLLAAVVAVAVGIDPWRTLVVAGTGWLVAAAVAARAAGLRPAGATVLTTLVMVTVAGVVSAIAHLIGFELSLTTTTLMWVAVVASVVRMPTNLMQTYESWEMALRWRWRRAAEPLTDWVPPPEGAPFVTVQVPTYAEPPDLVIGTLDALARLDYPHFEVMVVDNNTTDERLWRPVEEYCRRLGPRFRFLHVEGITGAKAGALNWSRRHLNPDTELIALLDADYQVDPVWLAHTVGHFDDPALGFVQCPHGYRDFEGSLYGRMTNAAYALTHETDMVARDEHNVGITVGTMSIIRLSALDAAGGWAEWCLTEDSEFSIRLHAAGYSSLFLRRRYGWGVIPETFTGLKKQRFRWTYGPGQEVKANWRRYVPGPWRIPSALTVEQRVRHCHYGLVILLNGLGVLLLPVSGALLLSLIAHHEQPVVDARLLLPVAAAIVARRIMRWLLYRRIAGASIAETIGGSIVLLSLRPTVSMAAFRILVGGSARWERTNKFRPALIRHRALNSTRTEALYAAACLVAAGAVPFVLHNGVATVVLALGFVWQATVHASGVAVAVAAEHALRRAREDRPPEATVLETAMADAAPGVYSGSVA